MPGLGPGIRDLGRGGVDARNKSAHDGEAGEWGGDGSAT